MCIMKAKIRMSPFGTKTGRGSHLCQPIPDKVLKMFKNKNKNNIPQGNIRRDISSSSVRVNIKRFKKSGGSLEKFHSTKGEAVSLSWKTVTSGLTGGTASIAVIHHLI